MRVLAASVTGAAHRRLGRDCQDAWASARTPAGLVLAIADGAGSREHAAKGARTAVAAACAPAESEDDPLLGAFASARRAVLGLASDPAPFACTLTVVVVGAAEVAAGQIGDGIVAVEQGGVEQGGVARSAAVTARGEYANETVFLTSRDAMDALAVERFPASEVTGVALSTDGLRSVILDDPAAGTLYEPFFTDLWAYARRESAASDGLRAFLSEVPDGTGDDKTLVVAVPGATGESRPPDNTDDPV
ncbi:PP2C family serine/threonine-protein phosphatase [Actinomadura decatromicini]|uniref:PP2C family serine/threonine-protein phosphatase n=1 Tax=Actinomadura decatromicini TaxID=2604572 RepID=UPI001652E493|nr:PP2C family serine/threonine-protein phosphatase [Actinomadura decatromicini]